MKSALATALSLKGGITFDIAVVNTTHIQFIITYSSSGWVGFGFGTWMWTNDLFTIEASGGDGTIRDYTMNYYSYPNLDTINNYAISTVTSGSTNTYTVTRLLNDGDPIDYVFTNGTQYIVYAWGSGPMSYHDANYGAFSLDLTICSNSSSWNSNSSVSNATYILEYRYIIISNILTVTINSIRL